jgi:BMFP domain-containing protein YqiC
MHQLVLRSRNVGDPSPLAASLSRRGEAASRRLHRDFGHPIVNEGKGPFDMTQTTGRFFDELGKLITDAAGAADGVRKEIESVVRAQAERVLRDLDVVQREDFEAVKAMAQKAREDNEVLKEKIAALEAAMGLAERGK